MKSYLRLIRTIMYQKPPETFLVTFDSSIAIAYLAYKSFFSWLRKLFSIVLACRGQFKPANHVIVIYQPITDDRTSPDTRANFARDRNEIASSLSRLRWDQLPILAMILSRLTETVGKTRTWVINLDFYRIFEDETQIKSCLNRHLMRSVASVGLK